MCAGFACVCVVDAFTVCAHQSQVFVAWQHECVAQVPCVRACIGAHGVRVELHCASAIKAKRQCKVCHHATRCAGLRAAHLLRWKAEVDAVLKANPPSVRAVLDATLSCLPQV